MRRPNYRPLYPEMYEDPTSCADAYCCLNRHSCPEGMSHGWSAHSDIRMRPTPKFMIVIFSLKGSTCYRYPSWLQHSIRPKRRSTGLTTLAVVQKLTDLVAR